MAHSNSSFFKVAIVQHGPKFYNLAKSMVHATEIIAEASNQGARLVAFGETWLTGYPAWLDHCQDVAQWNEPNVKEVYAELAQNSVSMEGPEVKLLCDMAKKQETIVAMGINEKVEKGRGSGTLYNSWILINEQGKVINHHRKLMPTYTEKLVYGLGNGEGLEAVDTSIGRIGGLICWEHWMPLARQAVHYSGEQIHLALWPWVSEMHEIASRHYAFEGRCYVLAIGQLMKKSDIPSQLKLSEKTKSDTNDYLLRGGSCVIGPDGQFVTPPLFDKQGIIYADLNLKDTVKEQMTLDVSGHYQRPDIFHFDVKTKFLATMRPQLLLKIALHCTFSLIFVATAMSQETNQEGFLPEKGTFLIGGGLGLFNDPDADFSSYTGAADLGFFVSPKVALGVSTSDHYTVEKSEGIEQELTNTTNQLSLGPIVRYQEPLGDRMTLTFQAQFYQNWATIKSETEDFFSGELIKSTTKTNSIDLFLRPGISYFLSPKAAVDFNIGALNQHFEEDQNFTLVVLDLRAITLGFHLYL